MNDSDSFTGALKGMEIVQVYHMPNDALHLPEVYEQQRRLR